MITYLDTYPIFSDQITLIDNNTAWVCIDPCSGPTCFCSSFCLSALDFTEKDCTLCGGTIFLNPFEKCYRCLDGSEPFYLQTFPSIKNSTDSPALFDLPRTMLVSPERDLIYSIHKNFQCVSLDSPHLCILQNSENWIETPNNCLIVEDNHDVTKFTYIQNPISGMIAVKVHIK